MNPPSASAVLPANVAVPVRIVGAAAPVRQPPPFSAAPVTACGLFTAGSPKPLSPSSSAVLEARTVSLAEWESLRDFFLLFSLVATKRMPRVTSPCASTRSAAFVRSSSSALPEHFGLTVPSVRSTFGCFFQVVLAVNGRVCCTLTAGAPPRRQGLGALTGIRSRTALTTSSLAASEMSRL